MKYTKHFSTKETLQSEPIPGSAQVANSAGGYSFAVDDWVKLDRFLILGTEGGSYYASERAMTRLNAESLQRHLQGADGLKAVRRIVEISEAGRAPKNDPAIFALAMCAKLGDGATRNMALASMSKVCRTGTHLFQFCEALQAFGGWGRGTKRAVGEWYSEKDRDQLAYQLIKYRQRNGWTHRDVLRLAKPHSKRPEIAFAVGKLKDDDEVSRLITGFKKIQEGATEQEAARLITEYRLPWEAVPTELLIHNGVWEALLPHMPLMAMVRNLGRMTANGFIKPLSQPAVYVANQVRNTEALVKSRIHPIALLIALKTYASGAGLKGKLTWTPVGSVVDAVDEAFYLAFKNIEPTNKRTLLALDVSGSMGGGAVAGVNGLTPRVASAAMAMVTARTEPQHQIMAFADRFMPLAITPRQRLDDIINATDRLPFMGTDCSLPMMWALEHKVEVDTFIIYTDSETYAGKIHPPQALRHYRDAMGIPAKLVVVGMVSNGFTIADPNDRGMLDIVGFDTATPSLISDFSKGD